MADSIPLRSLRLERSWSQEHLAELSGLSVRTIQRLEQGELASLETQRALSAAFDIPAAELVSPPNDVPVTEGIQACRRKFFHHLAVFAAVMTGLALFNLVKTPGNLWFVYPFLGWGLGIVLHAYGVFRRP